MKRRTCIVSGWLGLATVLAGLAGPVVAQSWDPARAVSQPGWVWADPQQLDGPQARLSVQSFRAPVPPLTAARRLISVSGQRLTRLQWVGPMLLLSGGRGEEHWLAQLQPGADGTAGLLSRLMPAVPAGTGFDPAALVPPGARRVLQARDGADDPASLSSFDCPGTPAQVAAAVRRALHAAGWSVAHGATAASGAPETGLARDVLPPDWRHPDGGQLSVHLYARRRSVALTFWHHPQEPS